MSTTKTTYVKALLLGWNQKRVRKVRTLLMTHGIAPTWHWPRVKQGLSFPKNVDLVICSTDHNSHASASYVKYARKKDISVVHMPARRSTASKILDRAGYPLLGFDEIARRTLAQEQESQETCQEFIDQARSLGLISIGLLDGEALDMEIPKTDEELKAAELRQAVLHELATSPHFQQKETKEKMDAWRDSWLFEEESQEVESEDSTEQIKPQTKEDTMSRKRKHKNNNPQPPPALITLSQAASLIQRGEQTVRDAINQARLTFVRNEKGEFLLDPIEVKKLPTTKPIYTMDSAEEKKYLLGLLPKKIATEPWGKDAEYSVGLIKELQEENGGTPRGWLVTRLLGSLRSQFGIKHRNAGSSSSASVTIYMDYQKYVAECAKYNFEAYSVEDLQAKDIKLKNIPTATEGPKPKEEPMQEQITIPQNLIDLVKKESEEEAMSTMTLEVLLKEVRKKMEERDIVQLVVTPTECEVKVMVVQTQTLKL
jgi:hypothetical protein